MSYDFIYKLILIGDPAVGKTSICSKLNSNRFSQVYETTVGVDFNVAHVMLGDGKKIKCQLWDTAGQETFTSIISSYYRNVAGAIVVFDLSNRESFEKLSFWLNEIKKYKDIDIQELPTIIIGNKLDKKREVSSQEANNFSKNNNCLYYEISAKDSINIYKSLSCFCQYIHSKYMNDDYHNGISASFIEEETPYDYNNIFKSCCNIS
jgi:small GTP-binding protein